jgi:hypothetical protein
MFKNLRTTVEIPNGKLLPEFAEIFVSIDSTSSAT